MLKCMVLRLLDLNVYESHDADYIIGWLVEYENGGAMPSEFWFRCPHGAQVKFFDCLMCIWRVFENLEERVHLVESEDELNETAEAWTMDHLEAEEVGEWDAFDALAEEDTYEDYWTTNLSEDERREWREEAEHLRHAMRMRAIAEQGDEIDENH